MDSILTVLARLSLVGLVPLLCGRLSAYPKDYDIVIYGGTSGGITAAVAGAKMGKKVALVSPTTYLGGLTTSGLGWTDIGKTSILGGLSKEFYHRVYLHYAAQPNWNSIKGMAGQHTAGFDQTNQLGYIFEPKVATRIYDEMLAETDVEIFTGLLDLAHGVAMDGLRITSIKLEDGRVFAGKMFIDASYEGDVMAGAGVSFFIGREANSVYGETISGVQNGSGNEVIAGLDPYVVKGNPASGLLPGIKASVAPNGTGDGNLQAYCFRMCLTNNSANRVMVTKPANYKDEDFELVFRAVEAGQTLFLKMDLMPNAKTDSNNRTGISTDYIGKNWGPGWDWSTLNHGERAALAEEHKYWQLGLLWSIQNHPRVLAKVGAAGLYPGWGFPADEFTDSGHFPPQLYVREARRMVSDYVMTTKNCAGTVVAPDSVGMGAYTMDSHHTQRFNNNGSVKNEGGVGQSVPAPYPISYRSLVPKVGQCENLLVPWCLSTSHMAFGSARMEPVFMTMGQSAATAAAMAINDAISVQQVPYERLAAKLRADGNVLKIGADDSITGIVVDNTDPGAVKVGDWTDSASTPGFYGGNYMHDGNTAQGSKSVTFTPVLPAAGNYDVSLRWSSTDNRATNVPVKVIHRDGTFTTTVNQRNNGGTWYPLGTFTFHGGDAGKVVIETTGADGFVIADAARWSSQSEVEVEVLATIPKAARGGGSPAELVFTRKGSTSAALTVNYTLSGTASPAEYSPALTGTINFAAGKREAKLSLIPLAGAQPLGPRELQIALASQPGYGIGVASAATLTFVDDPFNAWRLSRFDATQLTDPAISGATADPDGNGISNLMEFFTGGGPRPSLFIENGNLYLKIHRHRDAAFLKMDVWESPDLGTWTRTPELLMLAPVMKNGNIHQLDIPVRSGSPFTQDHRFFRVRVER